MLTRLDAMEEDEDGKIDQVGFIFLQGAVVNWQRWGSINFLS